MSLLCIIFDHHWQPANPMMHDFLGFYCTRCEAQKRHITNAETRRMHYLCKSYVRRMNFLKYIPDSEDMRGANAKTKD